MSLIKMLHMSSFHPMTHACDAEPVEVPLHFCLVHRNAFFAISQLRQLEGIADFMALRVMSSEILGQDNAAPVCRLHLDWARASPELPMAGPSSQLAGWAFSATEAIESQLILASGGRPRSRKYLQSLLRDVCPIQCFLCCLLRSRRKAD